MIRTKKICKEENCTQPLYARGWCLSHYKMLYLAPRQREKAEHPLTPDQCYKIPKRTPKRLKQERIYATDRVKFIENVRKTHNGLILCFFCNTPVYGNPSLHHIDGRDDALLLDKSKWVLSHNNCHVHEYHSKSHEEISWWGKYMERIGINYPELFEKELIRMSKSKL